MPRLSTNCALWVARALWLATAVLVALALSSAVDGRTDSANYVTATGWWLNTGLVVLALVVCGPVGLTIARMLTPTAVAAATVALVFDASVVRGIAAIAAALLATISIFMAETGEALVQVAAYGDERRLPLRAPAAMQIPMVISWLLWLATSFAGTLLLAARQWLLGGVVVAVAGVLTWLVFQRLHRFSCRWLVSVPAGVVVHDPVLLGETLMVLRANVQQARLALADTQAADLTGPAAGHALELTVRDMVQVTLSGTRAQPKGSAIHARAVLVAPSRPGRALRTLAERKITVV